MKSTARRTAFPVGVVLSALAMASCSGGGGSGAGSSGLPMTPAAPVGNHGNPQLRARAPHVSIKEITLPVGAGGPMGGIAVASDSSVYVSLYGWNNTPKTIGAHYANGAFTVLISFDPTFAGPPFAAVAATQNAAGEFATQLSSYFEDPIFESSAITAYGPGAGNAPSGFNVTGFTGEISDMAGDSSGNLWYATSPVLLNVEASQAAVVKIPEAVLLNGGSCCTPPSQTIVQLSNDYTTGIQALAAAPNGDAWAATTRINYSTGRSIYHISAAGKIVARYATPPGTNIGGMVVDGHDAVWFTDSGHNAIGKLDRRRKFSSYPIPTPASGVDRITVGGDGALWFTENSADKIGRITTNGHIHEYAVPTANAQPAGIDSLGPGCNPNVIWFVEQGADKIAEITIE